MSISVTSLKRLCRRHGVKRWPHRQLSGLNRAVAHLETKQQTSRDPSIAEQLRQLYARRDAVIDVSLAVVFVVVSPLGVEFCPRGLGGSERHTTL